MWSRYAGLIFVVAAILGLVVIVYAFLAVLVCLVGGTITGGLFRVSNLAMWALMCAQVLSDVASVPSPTLPSLIFELYRNVAVLQMQGVLMSPACSGASPFESEISIMSVALVLWLVTVVIYYCTDSHAGRLLGQASLTWAIALYPAAALTSTRLLSCNKVEVSQIGAAGLDGGPSLSSLDLRRTNVITVAVSAADPFYVCWVASGHHRVPGLLAAITVPVYVIGLPMLTLLWLWLDPWIRQQTRGTRCPKWPGQSQTSTKASDSNCVPVNGLNPMLSLDVPTIDETKARRPSELVKADPLLSVFFYDYKPSAWYTKHLDLGLLLLLSLFRALLPRPSTIGSIFGKAAAICTVLAVAAVHVLLVRPYLEADAWMGWVSGSFTFEWCHYCQWGQLPENCVPRCLMDLL